MKLRQKFFLLFMIVVFVNSIIWAFLFMHFDRSIRAVYLRIPVTLERLIVTHKLDVLAQFIRYYDEVLTESARNFAFTGDKKWEARYLENEPLLAKEVKEAINVGDEKDKNIFSVIDGANSALVEMEHRALDLVNNGKAEEAIALLDSDRYRAQKDTYQKGLREYVQKRGGDYNEALSFSTDLVSSVEAEVRELENLHLWLLAGFVAISLLVTILLYFGAFSLIVCPVEKITNSVEELGRGNLEAKIDVISNDEIGSLATSFNRMVDSLRVAHFKSERHANELEEAVRARTQELHEAKDELEQRVRKRTLDLQKRTQELEVLTEEQVRNSTAMLYMIEDLNAQSKELRESQEKLVRSEKLAVVGKLASSVAHELRNPLGVMKNVIYYLNMLGVSNDNPEIKENLAIMTKEINMSDKIITDLLDFSRIKKSVLHPEDVNLIIKEVTDRLELSPKIELVLDLGKDLPKVAIDALQIQQVFYNLAKNAVEAMTDGGRLLVRTIRTDDQVEISFLDTGLGILPENLLKIFDPLFSTKATGTGLGLSLCLSIVERHGGKIDVASEVGKGTKFTVRLPIQGIRAAESC